jgi:hypothetical protein
MRKTKMSKNLKSIEEQIAKLEQGFNRHHDPHLKFCHRLGQAVYAGLAPNERIVPDYYQAADGVTLITLERVTADPSDMGKDVPHGSWDHNKLYARFRHTHITSICLREKSERLTGGTQDPKVKEKLDTEESLDSILAREEECDIQTPWPGDD